jgi:hypothetical protein
VNGQAIAGTLGQTTSTPLETVTATIVTDAPPTADIPDSDS